MKAKKIKCMLINICYVLFFMNIQIREGKFIRNECIIVNTEYC